MNAQGHLTRLRSARGFTLIEISLVIALIIGLSATIGFGVSMTRTWKKGKDGALALQAVYAAQRSYMADNPTADITTVTATLITPYMPQGWTGIPVVSGLKDETLTVDFQVMPPRLTLGGSTYDPSSKTNDNLWDVGE